MKIQLEKLNGKYGAPMGRQSYKHLYGKVRLQRMEMSPCGAYDKGGAYWGVGNYQAGYMYIAQDEEGNQAFVRATTREKAKQAIREMNSEDVSFYR